MARQATVHCRSSPASTSCRTLARTSTRRCWSGSTSGSTMPFNAVAGADLNGDAIVSDFVPGTTRAVGNRDTATMLAAVNAYRATLGFAPIPASQIDGNDYNAVDMRVSKSFALGGR